MGLRYRENDFKYFHNSYKYNSFSHNLRSPSLKMPVFADEGATGWPPSLKMAVFADGSGFTCREWEDLVYLGLGFVKYTG